MDAQIKRKYLVELKVNSAEIKKALEKLEQASYLAEEAAQILSTYNLISAETEETASGN